MAPTLKSQIAHQLRELIHHGTTGADDVTIRELQDNFGTFGIGDTLPSIRALQVHYNCARDTIRDAIAVLTHEGLVVPRRGIGTIIRDTTPILMRYVPDKPARTWAEQMGPGADAADVVIAAEWEAADPETAAWLQIAAGRPVLHRTRHRSLAGVIAQTHDQWIVDTVALDIWDKLRIDLADPNAVLPCDLFSLMARAGHVPEETTEHVHARMPDADERELMDIPLGVPATVIDRVTSTVDGDQSQPLEGSRIVGAGDRMVHSYTMPLAKRLDLGDTATEDPQG